MLFCSDTIIVYCNNTEPNFIEKYIHEEQLYLKELNRFYKDFNVDLLVSDYKRDNIYYFGMANHQKYYYKKGQLIDLNTKNVVLNIDVSREFIIPNNYMVAIVDKNKHTYLIYENEDGIYIKEDDKIIPLLERDKKINLPEFKQYNYSQILKVLNQEVLFNIDEDRPIPNVLSYKYPWYRDSMMATMVLEKTNNIDIIKPWVSSIDSIYDYSRSKDIKEVDNLGELLYIIGATGLKEEKKDLIDNIINEINSIKKDHYLCGIVDYKNMCSYPTGVAIYGSKKINIDIDLELPNYDDGYGSLLWYLDNSYNNITFKNKDYPYLNWASYHNGSYDK